MKYVILVILSCITGLLSFAQDNRYRKLDAYFDTLAANQLFMGSIAISRQGIPVYKKSVGFRDITRKMKNNDSTLYGIGSITKTFTATLVLKAAGERLLDTGNTVARYFPGIKNGERITIAQLLRHRSGIHNFTNNPYYRSWSTRRHTGQQLLDTIIAGGCDFEPGSKMEYSNSNYILLTLILEKVYRQSYARILDKKMLEPLQLKHTRFGGAIEYAHNECWSYTFKNGWQPEQETDLSIPLGAGAIKSTPADLSRFVHALFAGRVIAPASLSPMKTAQGGAGMGMFPMTMAGKKGWGHTGSIDGFRAMYVYFPEDAVCLALFANGENYNLNTIATTAVNAFYDLPFELPDFTVFPVTEADLKPYTGRYASAALPLKITISNEGNILLAHPDNQAVYTMRALAKGKFRHDATNVDLEFNADGTMTLLQNGQKRVFKKEAPL